MGKSWGTAPNWSGPIPNAIGFTARINYDFLDSANLTLSLDGNRTIGTLNIGGATSIVAGSGGSLIFDVSSGNAAVNVVNAFGSSAINIAAPIVLNDSVTFSGSYNATLGAISGTGGITTLGPFNSLTIAGNSTYSGGTAVMEGTVNVGNGGTTGSLGTGDVFVDGSLVFNRSDDLTFSSNISGSGNVTKNFANTVTLTGSSTYFNSPFGPNQSSGFTSINAGTLQIGNGGTVGTLGGTNVYISAPATLRINRSDQIFLSNNLSGAGSFVQAGSGTSLLFGNNTYSGGTTISAGTVQVGIGGTAGTTGSGNVVNNGTLALNRSDSLVVGATISGMGALTQMGAGTSILTGNNSYSGPTTVTAGTLQVGNNGTSGTLGTGNITVASGGVLKLSRSDSITVANTISGAGSLVQSGSGSLSLTGNNTYTGSTTINSGRLANNATLTSNVTINSGGTYGGNGTTSGNLLVSAGGILAPGNSIGTVNVQGNATFATNGTYSVELGNASASNTAGVDNDFTNISGSLSLPAGNFNLNIIGYGAGNSLPNFNDALNYNWTIATAGLGITGFGSTVFGLNLSGLSTSYTGLWSVSQIGSSLLLNYTSAGAFTPVPEPATYAIIGVALCAGLAILRRRSAHASASGRPV